MRESKENKDTQTETREKQVRKVERRRERILRATVEVVAERGYAGTSVGSVIARAKVSRRTFEGQFGGLQECMAAVFDLGRERTIELVLEAFAGQRRWQDGVRMALASLLALFDSEPELARVWLVESLAAGVWAHEHRERNLGVVRELVVSSWPVSAQWSSPPLAAEGVIASVLGIVHAHIVTERPEPLIELLGPLMGLVAGPYVSPRAAAREVKRGEELAREIRAGTHPLGMRGGQPEQLPHARADRPGTRVGDGSSVRPGAPAGAQGADVGPMRRVISEIPAMLENPMAHRARECLLFVADRPGVSNREVGEGIGVLHRSQVSKLLGYLLGEDLVVKRSAGAGRPNAWRLSARGEEVARALGGERNDQRTP